LGSGPRPWAGMLHSFKRHKKARTLAGLIGELMG
jgi:hypothetical protein